MRSAAGLVLGLTLAAGYCGSAQAISTLEDILRDDSGALLTPSGMPPNSAIHQTPATQHAPVGAGNGRPGTFDQGPRADQPLPEIPVASAPWVVAIGDTEDLLTDFLCAGALIDQNWVLTVAHCLFLVARRWPNDSRPRVFFGSQALATPGQSFPIEEIVQHPEYDPVTRRNDLALLRFDPGTYRVTPIALDGPPIQDHVGEVGTVLGFGGAASSSGDSRTGALKVIQAAIVHNDVCFSQTQYPGLRNTGVYCARLLLKHHAICQRFTGSPMVVYGRSGGLYVVGLATWNTVCPLPDGKLNVFRDIQAQVPWVKSVIGVKLGAGR